MRGRTWVGVRGAVRGRTRAGAWVAVGAVLLAPALAGAAQPPPTTPPPTMPPPTAPPSGGAVLDELFPAEALASGITHREFSTTEPAGRVRGDIVVVDLTAPGVRVDLLTPGAVAARAPVRFMADAAHAAAGINGDFFDIGHSSAAVGPEVRAGRAIKAAAPAGRRFGPAVPGAQPGDVLAVGRDGRGRVDRLSLVAQVRAPSGVLPVVALNQHAVPVGGIGIVTADWGAADRGRTLCGSDVSAFAPCAGNRVEVRVRGGAVTAVGPPGAGTLAPGEVALEGREQGAVALRRLAVGTKVQVDYALRPASGVAPAFAVGGCPILRGGVPVRGLDVRERAPRSAVGLAAGGRRMYLVTVDGRQAASVGLTLAQLGTLLAELHLDDGVNLDGGGSSTLVYRAPGAAAVAIVNDPSDPSPRPVPNGIGVWG